jgi:hypothetical protein
MTVGNLPPIEEPQAYGGYLRALWRTWVSACFYPYKFFEAVGNSQNLAPALLFGSGCWFILGFICSLIISASLLSDPKAQKELGLFGMVFLPLLMVGCTPIVFFLCILFYGSILHLCLILFGGAKQGLRTTLRVVAYAQAPIVYFCGIWSLVLYMIGLRAAHRTDTWRSVLAVLVSQFLCCIGEIFLEALRVALISTQLG